MKIKYKLLGLIMIPLFVMIAYQAQSDSNFVNELDKIREEIISPSTQRHHITANLRFISSELAVYIDRAALSIDLDDYSLASYYLDYNKELREKRNQEFNRLKEFSEKDSDLIKEIFYLMNEVDQKYELISEEILSSFSQENSVSVAKRIRQEVAPLNDDLLLKLTELLGLEVKKIEESSKLLNKLEKERRNSLYIISAVSLIMVVILVMIINSLIVEPIESITNKVNKISKGDFSIEIESQNVNDEVALLTESLKRIISSMKLAVLRTGTNKEEFKISEDQEETS